MPSTDTFTTALAPVTAAPTATGTATIGTRVPGRRLSTLLLPLLAEAELLDSPAGWGTATTPAGAFRLEPVRLGRDLELLTGWMNDPEVAAYWELAGPAAVTAAHVRAQLDGNGHSIPCLGLLEGTPMSYWEIYRADLDPLSRHYPARPHDTGIHLLIGDGTNRGRGLGTVLLRGVADLVLDNRPRCTRVIAEPDIRNTPPYQPFSTPDSAVPRRSTSPRSAPP